MKIAWLVNNYPSSSNNFYGGIFFERMVKAISGNQVSVYVVQPVPFIFWPLTRLSRYRKYAQLPKKEVRDGVTIFRPRYLAFPRQNFSGLAHLFLYAAVKNLPFWKEIDIIDAKYGYPNGGVAYLLSKKFNLNYLISLIGHDINVDPFVTKINYHLQKKFLSKADGVICVNEELGVKMNTIVKKEYHIIRDGLDLLDFELEKKKRAGGPVKFVYVGSVEYDKGMHVIAALLQKYPEYTTSNYEWHFIGNVVNSFGIELRSNTFFHGGLKNKEVLNFVNDCDYMVFPSLFEGLPNALKEAALLKVPIIASNVGGIPSFLGYGERGYMFESENVDSLHEQLSAALNGIEATKSKANNLYNYTKAHFDIETNAAELIKLYKKILDK